MPTNLGSAYGTLVIDSSGVTKGINAAVNQLTTFESTAKRIGSGMSRIGDQLTQTLTLPIVGVGVAAGKMAMGFEASMQQIVGLVGVSQKQVNDWSQQLLELGPKVGKGPKELADALYFVSSSGLKGAEAIDAVTQSAKAASAGLGDTKIVADAVTSAMNAYRTTGMTAAQATDILVAAVREGKGEASEFAPVLGHVIPVAAEMGISFNQVAAAMAAMTLEGVPAAEAATNLSGIMSALIKPSKQASDVLAEFGLSAGQLRDIAATGPDGLLKVLALLKDTIGQDDEAFSKVFGNIRSLRGALELVGTNAQKSEEIFRKLAVTTGDSAKAFDAAAQTMKLKFDSALSTVQVGLIKFGDAVLPAVIPVLQDLAGTVSNVADFFSRLDTNTQQTIVTVLALVAGLGPLLSIGGRILSMFGALSGVLKMIGGGIAQFVGSLQTLSTFAEVEGRAATAGEALKIALSSTVAQIAVLVAALAIAIKFFDAASKAAHATNEELIAMANSNTGNVIEDAFTRAGAAAELLTNGSGRLRDAFIAHQDEMRKKLDAGEITLEQYNAEIERSAKVARLWGDQSAGTYGVLTRVDGAVKILTKSDMRMAESMRDAAIADEALEASLGVTDTTAQGTAASMQELIDKANGVAESGTNLAAENDAAQASLDQLRALIDGEVGPAYDEFIGKNDDLKKKIADLVAEQDKLQASQGKAIVTNKKTAMTANELAAAEAKRADVLAVMTAGQRKKNESDTAYEARMKGLQVQYDSLTEKIGGAETATTSYVDNSKRLGEISTELDGLNQSLADNAQAYDDRLKRILFDMAAEQLAANGLTANEMEALNALAVKFGMIDQDTADMTLDVLKATQQLAQDKSVENFVDNLTTDLDRAKRRAADVPADLAAVGDAYNRMAQDASTRGGEVVTATATMADQIGDPISRAQESFGKFATGVTTTAGTVKTQTTKMQTDTATAMSGMASTIATYGPGIGAPLLTGIQTMSSGVIDVLNGVLRKISEVISALTGLDVNIPQLPGGGGGTSPTPSPSPSPSPAPSPEPNCFVAGTPITLTNWSTKPIEAVAVGDVVLTFDPARTTFEAGMVTRLIRRSVTDRFCILFESGAAIEVTDEHPFYMPIRHAGTPTIHDEFVRAKDLQAGDVLTAFESSGTREEKIVQVLPLTGTVEVFNFNVEPHHTYVAGGFIVHNVKISRVAHFVIPTPNFPTIIPARSAATSGASASMSSTVIDSRTYYNTFQDTLTTKMYLEDQRRRKLRAVADTM